jgi:hypothetical protein
MVHRYTETRRNDKTETNQVYQVSAFRLICMNSTSSCSGWHVCVLYVRSLFSVLGYWTRYTYCDTAILWTVFQSVGRCRAGVFNRWRVTAEVRVQSHASPLQICSG